MSARTAKALFASAIAAVLLAHPAASAAHEIRPAYLEMHETAPGTFRVLWKTPMRGDARLALEPSFSGEAVVAGPVSTRTPPGAAVQEWTLHAPRLRGQVLSIDGLRGTMTDVLARIEFADGTSWTTRLTPAEAAATIPSAASALDVVRTYTGLGFEHILTGVDHLLFVLALILVTGGLRRTLLAVSAFTASHSVTLAAATLGFVHVPQGPVEAVIALSIMFVACEILRLRQGRPGIGARSPWIVAFSFGLLHGLGFAGALGDAGLPGNHVPLALLFFNVGVEAGHFLFVASVLALGRAAGRLRWSAPPVAQLAPTYAIGTIAAFWFVERVAAF